MNNNNMTALGKRVTLDAYGLKPALQAGIPVDKWSGSTSMSRKSGLVPMSTSTAPNQPREA